MYKAIMGTIEMYELDKLVPGKAFINVDVLVYAESINLFYVMKGHKVQNGKLMNEKIMAADITHWYPLSNV